jgi:prepilin-type N-terminal cleavage/methylation domain-containing protein
MTGKTHTAKQYPNCGLRIADCELQPAPGRIAPFRHPKSEIRNHLSRAFTMIELMVVVGILGLLLAIILPTANRVLQNTKIKSTLATMQVVENAIARFESDRPLGTTAYGNFPPPSFSTNVFTIPTRETFTDTNTNGVWDWAPVPEAITNDDGNGMYDRVYIRLVVAGLSKAPGFTPIIGRNPGGTPDAEGPEPYFTKDFLSIESLYFFISQFSPQGKAILSKLPASMVMNKDICGGVSCPDVLIYDSNKNDTMDPATDSRVDLFEIYDSWDRPLHYMVRPTPNGFEWELRSAGPDGKFDVMFTPEDQSDDVVLKGQ